ncbi:MAG: hypothetical protein AABY22_37040, partial [Nanoarchaeota archaeon]
IWNRSLTADEVKEQYYSNLYKYNLTQWYLYVNQTNLTNGIYFYQGFASDFNGNKNQTEERFLIVNLSFEIIDISNLGFQNINPGKAEYVNFSVLVSNYFGQNLVNMNATFSRGSVSRTNSSCVRVADVSSTIANYSCSVDIWYFDSSGEWNVSADVVDSLGNRAYRNETFVLMSDAAISHGKVLSFGGLFPGDTNRVRESSLNNTGNDIIAQVYVTGKNLLQYPSGTNLIPALNFSASDNSVSTCTSGIRMDNGIAKEIVGVNLAVGNNSAGLGQDSLFVCLLQVPIGLPASEYRASEANSWELTTFPPT